MSLPDAMSYIPGIWMQRTNHGGGSPFIRGLTGYQTLILIDGIRFNNSTFRSGPNQYLNTIDPYSLGRIEVLRGGGSVQYGSDAIGGAVYLQTRDRKYQESGRELEVFPLIKWISHGMELTGRAEINYSDPKNLVLGGFTFKDFGNIKAGGNLGELEPTGYHEYSGDIKIKRKLNQNNELKVVYQHLKQNDVPLYHKVSPGNYSKYNFDPQQRDFAYVSHNYKTGFDFINELKSTISYQHSLEARKKQKSGASNLTKEEDRVQSIGLNIEIKSIFNNLWSASSGFEIYNDHINSKSELWNDGSMLKQSRGLYPDNSEMLSSSIYSLHKLELNRFHLNGGLRFNTFSLTVSDSIFGSTKIKPSALVGSMGASYEVFSKTYLTASLSNAFRAPNINDVSSFGIADFRYEIPNFDLNPEYSTNYEVGVKTAHPRFYLALGLYQNDLRDLISNIKTSYQGQDSIDGYKVYHRENIKEARIRGIEIEAEYKVFSEFSVNGFIIYTHGENTSDSEPMRRIPPLYSQVNLIYNPLNDLSVKMQWIAAGKQERLSKGDISDNRIAEGGTPGWSILNLGFNFSPGRLQLNGGVNNIMDKAYRIHGAGIDGMGRHFWLSVSYRL